MLDLRDLICTAERLEARGFARRAAAAWRRVATHPEAPDELREKIWRCAGCESAYTAEGNSKPGRRTKGITEQMRQIAAMFAQGMKRQQIADTFGIHVDSVTRAAKAVHLDNRRRSLAQ